MPWCIFVGQRATGRILQRIQGWGYNTYLFGLFRAHTSRTGRKWGSAVSVAASVPAAKPLPSEIIADGPDGLRRRAPLACGAEAPTPGRTPLSEWPRRSSSARFAALGGPSCRASTRRKRGRVGLGNGLKGGWRSGRGHAGRVRPAPAPPDGSGMRRWPRGTTRAPW